MTVSAVYWGAPRALVVPCQEQWEGSMFYGLDTDEVLNDGEIQGLIFFIETAALCYFLSRKGSWEEKANTPFYERTNEKKFFKSLHWSMAVFVGGLYTSGFLCVARYNIVLLCISSWTGMLPLLTLMCMAALVVAYISNDLISINRLRLLSEKDSSSPCRAYQRFWFAQVVRGVTVAFGVFLSVSRSSELLPEAVSAVSAVAFLCLTIVEIIAMYVFYGYTTLELWHAGRKSRNSTGKTKAAKEWWKAQKWLEITLMLQIISVVTWTIHTIFGNIQAFDRTVVTHRTYMCVIVFDLIVQCSSAFLLSGMFVSETMTGLWTISYSKTKNEKVRELAMRAMTASGLLEFCSTTLCDVMPNYDARKTTTEDVVRRVIIPLTKSKSCRSYADEYGKNDFPMKMVTHNWQNKFNDLIAAVLADALGEDAYDQIAEQLATVEGKKELAQKLQREGSGSLSYWICAFCVNQHVSICDKIPDGTDYKPCDCTCEKYKNEDPRCEMDKFDDMMGLLKGQEKNKGDFGQVIAVDREFKLFERAWCVAEIAEASLSKIPPYLKVASSKSIDQHFDKIENLDVRKCEASRPEDKNHILAKIRENQGIDVFNNELCRNIEGMAFRWMRDEANELRSRAEKQEAEIRALRSELHQSEHVDEKQD